MTYYNQNRTNSFCQSVQWAGIGVFFNALLKKGGPEIGDPTTEFYGSCQIVKP